MAMVIPNTRGNNNEDPRKPDAFRFEAFHIDKREISPEYKKYILLLKFYSDDDYVNMFEIITGRDDVYKYIKDNIQDFNPNISLIMTEVTTFDNALTIIQFVRHLYDEGLTKDTALDLDDYEEDKTGDQIERENHQSMNAFNGYTYDELLDVCGHIMDSSS